MTVVRNGWRYLPMWIVALPALPALAANPDPIDATLERCLAAPSSQTTAGMVGCAVAATQAWDKRLNEAYKKAMAALDAPSQELLRASQRKWLAFREAERAAMGGPWRSNAGTIAQVLVANADMTAIKERTKELSVYEGN
jgi:uncharacterized protein YecT (DUF1311 family)